MRSPWVDLLFLHGHVTPSKLAWRPDSPACRCKTESMEVDIAKLPLPACTEQQPDCATCSA